LAIDSTYVLDPLVVTSTRVGTARRNVPGSVSVVSERELRATGSAGVLDALAATTPGVFVTERGVVGSGLGSGAAGQISIRGVGGAPNSQVLVLVDGRPDFAGLFGHPLPDAYALNEVDRVEVIRGPAAAIYGTNAMGGVVNIITSRRRAHGTSLLAHAQAGPWRTADADVTLLGAHAPFDYRLAIGHTRTDGHRPDADFRRTHLSGALGFARGPWDLRLQAATTPFSGHDPGPDTLTVRPDRWIDIVRNSAAATLTYHDGPYRGSLLAYRGWGTHRFFDGWHSDDYLTGVTAHASHEWSGGAVITAGADLQRYGGKATNDTTNYDYGSHAVLEYAPNVTVQVPIGALAMLTASARAQHHTEYGWIVAPEAGVSAYVLPRLTLRGSVSRGFRSPDLRALYLFPTSRTTLRPERVLNVEGGASWRVADWLVSETSVFRAAGDDIIAVRPPPPFPPAFENRGSFTSTGVETELRWVLPRLQGTVFAAWQDLDGCAAGTARRTIGATATTGLRATRVMLSGRWIDGLSGEAGQALPSYLLVNATLSHPIGRHVEAQVVLRNLLDERYETIDAYPMPGFHALVGLSLRMGQ